MKKIDLTGIKFGRLTVVREAISKHPGRPEWECLCECGNVVFVTTPSLRRGATKSCGCFHKDRLKETASTHGLTHDKNGRKTRLYVAWINMKGRCYKVNGKDYKYYGERGIKVCVEWLHSYENFYNWAIHNGYKDNLTLDRIEVNGNYEPNNCRWATQEVQVNNSRRNRYIILNGRKQSLSRWCKEFEVGYDKVRKRLDDLKWPIEKALGII